jgi:hypothetical protein
LIPVTSGIERLQNGQRFGSSDNSGNANRASTSRGGFTLATSAFPQQINLQPHTVASMQRLNSTLVPFSTIMRVPANYIPLRHVARRAFHAAHHLLPLIPRSRAINRHGVMTVAAHPHANASYYARFKLGSCAFFDNHGAT